MEVFTQLLIIAAVITVLTEQFKKAITDKCTRQASIAIGILLTVVYHQGILQAMGVMPAWSWGVYIDYILTGALVAFGPNVILAVRAKAVIPDIQITQDTTPTITPGP